MIDSKLIENSIKGACVTAKLESLLPSGAEVFPDFRITEYMMLGPFVLETEGAFETEYFYERNKVLDCDYLASSGGEAAHIPYLGKTVKNDYYGPDRLKWKKGHGNLRFAYGDNVSDAVFASEQRNCSFYAAVYIDCDDERDAVLCYESSGCKVYLNGELIDNKPYGRVKGLWSFGNVVSIHLNKGKNLLMFKVRTGYIADSIDISLTNCSIYPVAVKTGNFGVTYPQPTALYFGTKEQPLQMFQCFTWAGDRALEKAEIKYNCEGFSGAEVFENINARESRIFRLKLPASKEAARVEALVEVDDGSEASKGKISADTIPNTYFGFDYIFSDFHFDTTYHQEQRTYAMGALHITKCIVDKLIEDPDFKAVLSEVDYLHPYYSIYPKHREALKKAFEEGRAEADCFYNQPNALTSSGEGLVRNLVYGQLYHRDVLGRITHVFAPGDVFGHPNQMTQMCLKGGCKAMQWGKMVLGLDRVFRHVSPDGTVGIHNKCFNRNEAQKLSLNHSSGGSSILSSVNALPSDGKTGWMKETLNKSHYAVFSEWLDGIADDIEKAEKAKKRAVDIVSRDLTQHHSGVLLTRTDFKQANRLAENLLITAEKFSAIASYFGADYPEKALDKAWRQLLSAQHHDSITGTNNEISFVDLMIQYRETVELAADIVNRATSFLASGVKTGGDGVHYCVFNPHAWARRDRCIVSVPEEYADGCSLTDCDGNEYPLTVTGKKTKNGVWAVFTADIPACGYKTFRLNKRAVNDAQDIITDNCTTIENEFYKVCVDPKQGGGIVSIFDKEANKEVLNTSVDGPANRIAVLREVNNRLEEQHELYTTGQKMFSTDYTADVMCEKTNAYEKLTTTVTLDVVARVRQETVLWKGVKRIDFKTVVEDYQSKDDLFAVTFPVDVEGGHPVFDDRFAPHVWSRSQKKLSFQTHQYLSFSHSKIAPVNQWIEVGQTVKAELDDGTDKSGEFNIGMTAIIRNPSLYEETDALLIALSKKAIPVTPYSDGDQSGTLKLIHFNEDLDNTDTRIVLSVAGTLNEYEEKLISCLSVEMKESFEEKLSNNGCAVLFTRDCDNVYRKPIDVILIKAADVKTLTSVIAEIAAQLGDGSRINIPDAVIAEPVGHVENYGVALINNGNISCSVEPDNLMTMMLFHTAEFYGNDGRTTGGKPLVPEQKTHSFTYALYPHTGDYREANVYKKAFEFNDPFICAEADGSGKKVLPMSESFLQTSDNFIVTSLKAGGYPMASMRRGDKKLGERGLALRGFEIDGIEGDISASTKLPVRDVERTDLLEENKTSVNAENGVFSVSVSPHSIETFVMNVAESKEIIGTAKLGAEREEVEPSYVRSWEHDLGSMNMGYLSVAGVIGKDVQKISDTEYRFDVSMANNYPDEEISGTMKISVPDGFSADKTELPYSVPPRGVAVFPLTVKKPDKDAKGVVRLNYSHDGQEFEDMYEFGYFNPEVNLSISGNKLTATVYNGTCDRIYGEIAIATPYETWGVSDFNENSLGNISPRTQKFDVLPGEYKDYVFEAEIDEKELMTSYWAVVKLMANGRIHFAYSRVAGKHHNFWANEFGNIISDNNGSIMELLKL